MAEGGEPSQRIIIPRGTLDPTQTNIVEIPEACEDSRTLIARLQAKFSKPPNYYPPKTNPDNKFERRIGETVVGLGMPPCSPIPEERHNYQYSLSQYGPPPSPVYESYEPSYFGQDTTHGSNSISGKFDYCPSSTPIPTRAPTAGGFPSPRLSPIGMGTTSVGFPPRRPTPSPVRPPPRPSSPVRSPPRHARQAASPETSCTCNSDDISALLSGSGGSSRGARALAPRNIFPQSPRRPTPSPPRRSPPPPPTRRAPPRPTPRRPPSPVSDSSVSFGDLSDMMSFEASRGGRSSLNYTPDSIRGMSQIYRNVLAAPSTPMPEEIEHSTINNSMMELDHVELEERATIQECMHNFQAARRQLLLSILSLPEAEVPTD